MLAAAFALLLALVLLPAAALAQTYLIEIQHGGAGTITPSSDFLFVAAGDSAQLDFVPDDCNTVGYVEVDNAPVGAPSSWTFRDVHEDHLVYVGFQPQKFTITATAGPDGAVIPSGATIVACGGSQTFDIHPLCAAITDVVVDGVSVGPVDTYTFTDVRSDHTLHAVFTVGAIDVSLVMQPAVGQCTEPSQAQVTVTGASGGIVRVREAGTVLGSALVNNGGTLVIPLARLTSGIHTLVAEYDGGQCNLPTQSAPVSYTVDGLAGTLTLTAVPTNPRGNQAARLTATVMVGGQVATSANGPVTFREGANVIGTASVLGGVALFDYVPTDFAPHTVTAEYGGNGCISAATSSPVTVTLAPATGSMELVSSSPIAGFHADVTFTANVYADGVLATWAAGHVNFFDGATPIGNVTLFNGQAVLVVATLDLGTHTISAQYPGEPRLSGASGSVSQTIVPGASVTTLVSSANPQVGLTTTFVATVQPSSATGTITFSDPGGTFAVVPLSGNSASTSYTSANYGTFAITASYSGDTHVAPSTKSLNQTFIKAATSVAMSSSANPGPAGQPITVTAVVTPSAATGTIQFRASGVPFATVALSGGVAQASLTLPQSGAIPVQAVYSGDGTYAASTGAYTQNVVPRVTTSILLTGLASPVLDGTLLTLNADLLPTPPGASITFSEGATTLAVVAVTGNRASLTNFTLPLGHHVLTASYAGNASYLPASSSISVDVVAQLPTATQISAAQSPVQGRDVVLTVRVSPSPPDGTVVPLGDDSGPVANLVLAGGQVTYSYRSPVLGTRHLSANFPGTSTLLASTGTLTLSFVGAPVAIDFTALPTPVPTLAPVTLRAAFTPADASGSVTFTDGATAIGTAAVAGGVATLTRTFADAGTHVLQAIYSGDTTYSAKTVVTYLDVIAQASVLGLVASEPTSFLGDYVRLTATASPAGAGGNVTFYLDTHAVAVVPVTPAGVATYVTHTLAVGTHSATATYDGGTAHLPSSSALITLRVLDAPPSELRILVPNGGETWLVGSAMEIRWTQVPPPVTKVDLYVSRVLPPVWEPLALGVPNTGSYVWTVGAPGTNVAATPNETAMIAVIDPSGQAGSDASDLPFSIIDLATPAALERFEATGVETGVRLTWSAAADAFAAVALERADAAAGPWRSVDADVRRDGDATVADDRTAAPGRTYWYRLVATTASGSAATFGPVRVTAGGVLAFAFAAPAPNPARGAVALSLALPEAARVRVAIADIAGREVAVVTDGAMTAGRHTLAWDGRDAHGMVAPGLYFVTCRAGTHRAVQRLVMAR